MKFLIKKGRVIDPSSDIDDMLDILISGGRIEGLGKNLNSASSEVIDASGKIVAPGLIDMHAHLREPGREDEETIATGTRAAIRGGFTSIACMPNTQPPIDNPTAVRSLESIIKRDGLAKAFIVGAITKGRKGKGLTDFNGMRGEGIVAISDDGASVEDDKLMSAALKRSKESKVLLIAHCEDSGLSNRGVVNQGFIATRTGLRGIPREAEYARVERDIKLAKNASAKIHIAHVSLKESVDIIRRAKRSGVGVSAETAPHYFSLTDECCATYDTNTKMNPPLRTKEDVEAIKKGLKDGTIDAIATDHAPHTDSEKGVEFDFAPFGIIGLETALSLSIMELVEKKVLSWKELVSKMSTNPAAILGIAGGSLKKGQAADITVIDPNIEYTYKKESIESKSRNSPFIDWRLKGRPVYVFVSGKLVMKDGAIVA